MNQRARILIATITLFCTVGLFAKTIDGKTVAREANKIIGTKYVWGGNSNTKGLDCSALVKNIYSKYGYKLPRKASWQVQNTKYCPTFTDLSDAKIGDTLYFKNRKKGIHHTAIVTGFTKKGTPIITHAKGKRYGVVREVMSRNYQRELFGIKRFHNCTSPLSGKYTEKEMAEAIVYAAKKINITAEELYYLVERTSSMEPLLITIEKQDNQNINFKGLKKLKENGIILEVKKNEIKIYPRAIKEAKMLMKALYDYGFNYKIGLMQIDTSNLRWKEISKLIYPQANLNKYIKQSY